MNRAEVKTLIRRLNSVYDKSPNPEDLAEQIEDWTWALEDADAGAIMAAAKRLAAESRFYPKVAELRDAAQQNGLRADLYHRWAGLRARYQAGAALSPGDYAEWDRLEIEIGMPGSARRTSYGARA